MEQGRRLKTSDVAESFGISERTIRNWKREYLDNRQLKVGRPTRKVVLKLKLVKLVKEEWQRQGRPGWRPVAQKLKGHPVDLIQRYVAQLKKRERKISWEYKKRESKRIDVLFKDIVWTQDATYLKENKKSAYAEVLKDRCTLEILEAKKVDGLKAKNVHSILRDKELPLVYMTDNGSAYCSHKIENLLRRKRVIHLKNLPATPQHNGSSEIAVRELKRQVEILEGEGLNLERSLLKAKRLLNTKRLWRKHGYITAHERSLNASLHNKEEVRDKIYNEYTNGLVRIKKTLSNRNKQRLEERELVFSLLEKYGLIKRYRGSQNYAA